VQGSVWNDDRRTNGFNLGPAEPLCSFIGLLFHKQEKDNSYCWSRGRVEYNGKPSVEYKRISTGYIRRAVYARKHRYRVPIKS
jgi:hypothetical protein